jgi:H+-transporting ATPase
MTLVLTSQFRIYLLRERRHFWDSRPGRGILISSAAAVVVFSLLRIFEGIVWGLGFVPVLFLVAFLWAFHLRCGAAQMPYLPQTWTLRSGDAHPEIVLPH